MFFRLLPLSWARRFARLLGRTAYYFATKRRRIAIESLRHAFPSCENPRELRAIARKSFQSYSVTIAELAHLPSLYPEALRNLVSVRGVEHVDLSSGALMVGAHMANWEWLAPALAARGYRVAEVVNSYRDGRRNELIDRVRRAGGVETIPKDASSAKIKGLLSKKYFVGILADQGVRRNRVSVNVFGRTCWATAGPALIHFRTKAPVHMILMHREPDGRYVIDITPPLTFERSGNLKADVEAFTQLIQTRLEEHIVAYPGQWLWMHDRWKLRSARSKRRNLRDAVSAEEESEIS